MAKNNLQTKKQKVIVIIGPTASGKSDLALRLAKLAQGKLFKKKNILGAEIISADSRQVYRGMDIGTGKVTKREQKAVKHYLLDVINPKKQFTANDFKKLGEKALKEIGAKKKIPIIVGGTGFYIDILLNRMQVAEVSPNKKLRAQFDKLTVEKLFEKLKKLNPQRAKTIDSKNKRRLIRAIEIAVSDKGAISKTKNHKLETRNYDILWLGINPGKEKLAGRIAKRLDKRLEQGMTGEVKKLIKNGVSHKRLRNFGLEYKWLSLYLQGKVSYKEMRDSLLRDIVRYSKRQMTWFKKNKEIHWLALNKVEGIDNYKSAERLAKQFIS